MVSFPSFNYIRQSNVIIMNPGQISFIYYIIILDIPPVWGGARQTFELRCSTIDRADSNTQIERPKNLKSGWGRTGTFILHKWWQKRVNNLCKQILIGNLHTLLNLLMFAMYGIPEQNILLPVSQINNDNLTILLCSIQICPTATYPISNIYYNLKNKNSPGGIKHAKMVK